MIDPADARHAHYMASHRPRPQLGSLVFEQGAMIRGGRVFAYDVDRDTGFLSYHCAKWERGKFVTCVLRSDQIDEAVGEPDHFAIEQLILDAVKPLANCRSIACIEGRLEPLFRLHAIYLDLTQTQPKEDPDHDR